MTESVAAAGQGPVHGLVCIDKPSGPTSYRVLRDVQRRLGAKKAGHTGTLDPLASGLLVMLLGEGTKLSRWVMGQDKTYLARVSFGQGTDTLDSLGKVVNSVVVEQGQANREAIEGVMGRFLGDIEQEPPAFSALKKDGRTLMSRARAGEIVEPEARTVTCHDLQLLAVEDHIATLRVRCGKGFYVRSLARDLGHCLGLPAHLCGLRREAVGSWSVERSKEPGSVLLADVVPLADALPEMPKIMLDDPEALAIRHGKPLQIDCEANEALLVERGGQILAIAGRQADGWWRVVRGFSEQVG